MARCNYPRVHKFGKGHKEYLQVGREIRPLGGIIYSKDDLKSNYKVFFLEVKKNVTLDVASTLGIFFIEINIFSTNKA